jgi:hypothetical protein
LQVNPQALLVQVGLAFVGAVQAASQAPQWLGLVFKSTHAAPHCSSCPVQLEEQTPLAQTWPSGQALSQVPQCCGSLAVSTQSPKQSA